MKRASGRPRNQRRHSSQNIGEATDPQQTLTTPLGGDQKKTRLSISGWRLPFLFCILLCLTICMIAWGLPTLWLSQAEAALVAGRYDDADSYFQLVQRLQPRNTKSMLGQARVARCSGDPARARALLSIAESNGANTSRAALERELLQIQNGGSAEWIDKLPTMLVKTPEYGGEILEAFAFGFEALGSPDIAIQYVDDWIAAAPTDARALQHKAELLATLGQKEASETTFEAALAKDSSLIRSKRGLARLKMEREKFEDALKMFDALLDSDPKDVPSHLLRCSVLFSLHRDSEAIDGLRKILTIDEFNFSARHSLASKMAEQDEHREVVDLIEPLMHEFQDDVSLNYLLASAYTESGKEREAETCLKRHLEGRKALNELGILKYELKDRQSDGQGMLQLAVGYLKYQWDEAEPWLIKAIAALPDSPEPYRAMANYQRKKGDLRRATEYVKAANAQSKK